MDHFRGHAYSFAAIAQRARTAVPSARTLVDLSIGSPDQPVPRMITDAIRDALGTAASVGYPAARGDAVFLRTASQYLSNRFDVEMNPERELLALAGSKEGIAQLLLATLKPGDVALIPDICYPVYDRAARLAQAEVELLPTRSEQGFVPEWSHFSDDILRRAKILIVNYPNNPTGAVVSVAFYERAVEFARRYGLLLVSDAAYVELGFDGLQPPSVFNAVGARDVALEFHSLSKSLNMAGLRLGFVTGSEHVLRALSAYRAAVAHAPPTALQRGAAIAFQCLDELVPPIRATYEARRNAAVAAFERAGWVINRPSGAMYLWFRIPSDGGAADDWGWTGKVLERTGVVLAPGSAFGPGGKGYARLSLVRDEVTLAHAIERITAEDWTFNNT